MSGVLGKCQSNGPKIQLLEEEQAAKSIVVSNISPQTTEQGVMIHFQRRKNGGGEIDHIHIPKKGSAVVTFEKGEVIETVLEQSHTLDGSILKLHRLIPDDSFEVLQRVEARINFDRFPQSSLDWKKELEALKDETDVECRQLFNREYVLCGTFNQISTAQMLVQGIPQERPSLLQQSKRGNDVIHQVDTTQAQQNSSEVWDIDNLNTSLVSSFEVQPQFMKFIQQVHRNKLQQIEETHGVKIVWIENASQVQIHSSELLNHPHSYRRGCDSFIDLYQKLYPKMGREVVDIKRADNRELIIEAINTVERENQVIIEIKGNKLLVFAEKNNITTSVQALKETLGSLQGGSRKTNTNLGVREHENVQENRFLVLEQLLSHGVKLSLYQSDITDERVDAIVNAANDGLRHGGGVAAAIVRKGGHQIEEDSRQIMFNRNYCPLNVGDAVYTRGGNLSCQFVIHTVGPRWNAHEEKKCTSLLRRACVESLRLAAKLNLRSIAFPAVRSGIFGMPKSICACGMFQAMEEFSSSTDAEISTLRDVRIIIIDDKTINAFREVFVKRFSSPETSSAISPGQERLRPFNEEQESFSVLNVVANHPGFSSAANEPSKKSGKDDVESRSKRVDPNAENNEPRDEEQESPSALNVLANHPAFSLADKSSDKPSEKTGDDNNAVESLGNGVDPNTGNNEPPNKEQGSSSALNVVTNHPAFASTDNLSDKLSTKTGEDNNDVESPSKGVDTKAENSDPLNEEQKFSSALNVLANHPAFSSADNLSDEPSRKSGKDDNDVESRSEKVDPNVENNEPRDEQQQSPSILNDVANHPAFSSADNWSDDPSRKSERDNYDVESRSKRVDPNAENNEPRNKEQESSTLNAVGNHPAFSLADKSSDKPPRKTGEYINDVDSLSNRVDPNAEINKPPNEEHESSSALKVVANHPAFSSADNWSDKPPKKTGEDINYADSLSTGVDPNPENNKPPNEEQEFSSALNVVANHPACFSADNRSDKPLKQTGEGTKDVEPRKQMPDSIKDGHSASTNITSPSTDVKTSNVDTKVNALVKGPELSNMAAAVKPLRGRGKGIAATFSGRSYGETGSKSSGSTQLPRKTGETKSVNTGGGRGMTYAATNSPPGLTVTEEGQHLAREHANRVKGDQNTDPAELMKEKEESERNESNNGAIEDENQELTEKYHQIDEDKLNNLFCSKLPPSDGITNQEETRPSNDEIVNQKKAEETTKNTVKKPLTDDERSLPTDENVKYTTGPIQPNKMPDKGMQVDQSSSSAVNNEASYPEEQLPPSHLEMSPEAEAIAPTASYGSDTVQDAGKERQATSSDAVCRKENRFQGNQPVGYMTWRSESRISLSGYEKFGTIVLTFNFESGIQGTEHPNPGEPYSGLFCTSYLPNNSAGQEVCKLLRSAFDTRLIFTIGKCLATGEENKIVFNGIELKTNRSGGPANFGYPDPSYLDRVKSQLAEKGITQPLN